MSDYRLTLVVAPEHRRPWDASHVLLVGALEPMRTALPSLDLNRIILDNSASADEFLRLLATLPAEIAGDVMLIREDGGGFLSAAGRGGDRVIYELSARDVDFYVETNDLTSRREDLALSA